MSSAKVNEKMNIDEVLDRLKRELNVSQDNKLSEILGLSPQGFINKRNKGTLLVHIFKYAINRNMNLQWLFYGDELGPGLIVKEPDRKYDLEQLRKFDLLKKTSEILDTKGTFSATLETHINVFHRSIAAGYDYAEMLTKMEALEEKDKETGKMLAELAQQIQILQEENLVLKQSGSFEGDPDPEESGAPEPAQPSSRKTT